MEGFIIIILVLFIVAWAGSSKNKTPKDIAMDYIEDANAKGLKINSDDGKIVLYAYKDEKSADWLNIKSKKIICDFSTVGSYSLIGDDNSLEEMNILRGYLLGIKDSIHHDGDIGILPMWVGYKSLQPIQEELVEKVISSFTEEQSFIKDGLFKGERHNFRSGDFFNKFKVEILPKKLLQNLKLELHKKAQKKLLDVYERTPKDIGESAVAVYIIASQNHCKVGISNKPEQRLREVQTGNPEKLYLSRVVWFLKREDAVTVESSIHEDLEASGFTGEGEWFNCSLQIAEEHIKNAVKELCSDGIVK